MGTCSVRDGICKAKRLDIGRRGGVGVGWTPGIKLC